MWRVLHASANDPQGFKHAFLCKMTLALREEGLPEVKESATSVEFRGAAFRALCQVGGGYLNFIDYGVVEVNGTEVVVRYRIRTRHLLLYMTAVLGVLWIIMGFAVLFGGRTDYFDMLGVPPLLFLTLYGGLSAYVKLRFRALIRRLVQESGGSFRVVPK